MGFFLFVFQISYLSADQGFENIESKINELANKYSWHGILDFNKGKLESKNQNEYLSNVNGFNPKEELRLSIIEYFKFLDGKTNFFCMYPSRAIFISNNIHEIPQIDFSQCAKYNSWIENGSIESISFMYVTGYLKNPASFFGHTLLKFNRASDHGDQLLLEKSLNYGAETNNDAALPYVIKGLVGKYKASLQEESFFRLSAQYQEFQMRDIYEYELGLSDYQKNLILAYTFEMNSKNYDYYFLGDNCAYRINRILGIALEGEPMPKTPWKAPVDLLIKIQESGLVSEVKYHPSQTTRTVSAIEYLSEEDKNTLYKVFNKNIDDVNNTDRLNTIDLKLAAIEYLNYKKLKSFKGNDKRSLELIDSLRKDILLKINTIDNYQRKTIKAKSYPHEIVRPTLIRYKIHKNKGSSSGHSFRLRGANFEILDEDKSRTGNSEFVFLSPQITFFDGDLFIDEITLFRVLSLNDFRTPLPNELNYSWGIDISRKNISSICYPCNVTSISGTFGKSLYLSNNLSFYSLLSGSAHQSRKGSGNLSADISSGFILSLNKIKINISFDKIDFEDSNIFDEISNTTEVKFNINKTFDFSIYHKKSSKFDSIGINLNRYF